MNFSNFYPFQIFQFNDKCSRQYSEYLPLIGIKDSIIENSRIFQTYLHELSSPRLPWGKVGKNKFQLNWHKRPFPGRKMRVGGHLYWTLRWTFHKQFLSIWLLHIIVEPWYMAACTTVRPREFVPSGGPPFSIKSQPIKKSTRY